MQLTVPGVYRMRSPASDTQVDELQIPKLQAQVLIMFNNNYNNITFSNVCFLLALCVYNPLCVCVCVCVCARTCMHIINANICVCVYNLYMRDVRVGLEGR